MIDSRRFWLAGNLVTLLLHAAGLWLYVTDGFTSPVAQLWAVIIAIHILEIPLAFLAVAERRIPWGLTVINTLIFGFTWWVPTLGRCIVPDLIGMGDSDKLPDPGPGSYRFVEHRRYLDGLLDALGVNDNVILVLHDWGSGLGFDWANRHRDRVAGICYMEAIVQPLSWSDLPDSMQGIFQAMRSSAGEEMVLDKNVFVERILPASIQRELSVAEMDEYRRPFTDAGEARRPTLTWPRQIPIDGEPADVTAIVDDYGQWLATSDDLPKLFINAEPGIILTGGPREFCRSWPNQTEVTVDGLHFIQEDSPDAIGRTLAAFVQQVRG